MAYHQRARDGAHRGVFPHGDAHRDGAPICDGHVRCESALDAHDESAPRDARDLQVRNTLKVAQ